MGSNANLIGQAAFGQMMVGTPTLLGAIVSTTTKTNGDTAVPFDIPAGALLLIQPSAAVHVYPVSAADGAATTSNGIKLVADEKFLLRMKDATPFLAIVGAATTRVWALQ
jgi:hypothetical protein